MELIMLKCFLTDSECATTEVSVDGVIYNISEAIADEYPLKKIKEMIKEKLEKQKNNKVEIISKIEEMAKSMNMSVEEMMKTLGITPTHTPTPALAPTKYTATQVAQYSDLEFKAVDGGLKSTISKHVRSVSNEYGDVPPPGIAPFGNIRDKEGKGVVEEGKMVAVKDNMMISKGSMGITTVSVKSTDASQFNKMVSAVDKETNMLIRPEISSAYGDATKSCPVCDGTGFHPMIKGICPKCGGSGFIILQ